MRDTKLNPRPSTAGAWPASLAFWACLAVAAGLYALAALAPRIVATAELESEHHHNQIRLVALEADVRHLALVADSLESDPRFAEELLRVDFGARREDEERIAVDANLKLGAEDSSAVRRSAAVQAAWYVPLLRPLAEQRSRARTGLLAAAAVLTLFAFAFLHDGYSAQVAAVCRAVCCGGARLCGRYRRYPEQRSAGRAG